MNKFRDVLQTWQKYPVNVNGSAYTFQEMKDDYIKLTKVGEDGLTDTMYLPLEAVSYMLENRHKIGSRDRDTDRNIYLK